MSLSSPRELSCPDMHAFEVELWDSIDVQIHPDLKQALLDGRLNVVMCPECRRVFYHEQFFLYHDKEAELLAFVYPENEKTQAAAYVQKMEEDFAAYQKLSTEGSITYKPRLFWGIDDLLSLVVKEDDARDQYDVAEALAASVSLKVLWLPPSLAREYGMPRALILDPLATDIKTQIARGAEKIVHANDRLALYAEFLGRLVQGDSDALPYEALALIQKRVPKAGGK